MKLHASIIDKLIHMYETYGGHRNEARLRSMLQALEVSEYQRKTGEKVLVLTEDLAQETEQLQGK